MSFFTDGLPVGLVLTGDTISGNPNATGVFHITLSVSNYGGADSKTLKLIIKQAGNSAPVITSLPTAAPNPAPVGTPVSFFAQATDIQ